METIKAKYAVVKTSEFGAFSGERQLATTVIKVFKGERWSGFNQFTCSLIKDAEITVNGDKVLIEGTESLFRMGFGKNYYGKKFELFHEYDEEGRLVTVEDVQRIIKIQSKDAVNLEASQIKLFYDGFWDFIRGKKMYYVDTTPELISAILHVHKNAIQKDEKKGYFVDGSYQTTFTKPYKLETNNYRIENN